MYPGWVITVMPLITHSSIEPTFSLIMTLTARFKNLQYVLRLTGLLRPIYCEGLHKKTGKNEYKTLKCSLDNLGREQRDGRVSFLTCIIVKHHSMHGVTPTAQLQDTGSSAVFSGTFGW